jgi:hypothetical protein
VVGKTRLPGTRILYSNLPKLFIMLLQSCWSNCVGFVLVLCVISSVIPHCSCHRRNTVSMSMSVSNSFVPRLASNRPFKLVSHAIFANVSGGISATAMDYEPVYASSPDVWYSYYISPIGQIMRVEHSHSDVTVMKWDATLDLSAVVIATGATSAVAGAGIGVDDVGVVDSISVFFAFVLDGFLYCVDASSLMYIVDLTSFNVRTVAVYDLSSKIPAGTAGGYALDYDESSNHTVYLTANYSIIAFELRPNEAIPVVDMGRADLRNPPGSIKPAEPWFVTKAGPFLYASATNGDPNNGWLYRIDASTMSQVDVISIGAIPVPFSLSFDSTQSAIFVFGAHSVVGIDLASFSRQTSVPTSCRMSELACTDTSSGITYVLCDAIWMGWQTWQNATATVAVSLTELPTDGSNDHSKVCQILHISCVTLFRYCIPPTYSLTYSFALSVL